MVIADFDQPLITWHAGDAGTYFTIFEYFLDAPESAEGIDASIRRILQDLQNTAVGQASPLKFTRPHTAIASLRKQQILLGKTMNNTVGRTDFEKRGEDQPDRTTDLFVRIFYDPICLVKHIANRQGKTQLSFLGFVQLCAL